MGKLMLNDINYSGGGGDSSVIPNPQGTPTDTLNTIEIDSTIYDIAGSGGSGGCAKIVDTLWEGTIAPPTSGTEITLNHKVSDYDVIVITLTATNATYEEIATFQTDSMVIGQDYMLTGYFYTNSVALIAFINYTSDTSITVKSTASAIPAIYHKIQGIKFCGTFAPMIYSLEEREVGAWTDNKPLYQKTLIGTSTGGNITFQLDLTAIDVKTSEGQFITSAGVVKTMPFTTNSTWHRIYIGNTYGGLLVENNVAGTAIVTIRYTKTSDVAGSGSYGSLGIPMEHYDDTERVVGTYFGETLYQKTIPNISITGTTTTIQTGVNIDSLVAVEANGYKIDGGGNIIRFKESYNDGGDRLDVEGINNDIRVICSSWFNGSTMDITIKYTKSST